MTTELPQHVAKGLLDAHIRKENIPDYAAEFIIREVLRNDPFLRAQLLSTVHGQSDTELHVKTYVSFEVSAGALRTIHDKMIREMEQRT